MTETLGSTKQNGPLQEKGFYCLAAGAWTSLKKVIRGSRYGDKVWVLTLLALGRVLPAHRFPGYGRSLAHSE